MDMDTIAPIEIYVTKDCPYCVRAKNLFKQRGYPYREIAVDNDPDKRAWLQQVTQRRTVPQIFIRGQAVGGFDDIVALDRAGLLEPMVLAEDGRSHDKIG